MIKSRYRKFIGGIILTLLFISLSFPSASARETITGGTIIIGEGETTEGFTAMGGEVIIKGTVEGDVSAFSGNVIVMGNVDGDLSAFAGNIVIGDDAEIDGSFKAVSGNVDVNGAIDGDVDISSGSIILGPNAEIKGNLEYTARRRSQTKFASGGMPKIGRLLGRILQVYWFFLTLIIGAILLTVAPKFSSQLSDRVIDEPFKMGAVGFLVLIGVPAFLIILLITIIGIPFAIGGGLLFLLFVWIAGIYGKFAFGTWILSEAEKANQYAALVVGLLIGVFLGYIPFLGGLISFVIRIIGMGAFAYMLKVRIKGEKKAALKNI
jgi:cytoskeletal protein CcmA (bactofilin family)